MNENEMSRREEQLENNKYILQKYMDKCVAENNFTEAESAKLKIQEINQALQKQRLKNMNQQHVKEKMEIEESYLVEAAKLESAQKQELKEHQEESQQKERALLESQKQSYEDKERHLQATCMKIFKYSAELLNQKKIKEQLVKQKSFIEADKVHNETVAREQRERDDFERARQEKIQKEL
jgi:hypothetical protein